jgi:hypothetical protein
MGPCLRRRARRGAAASPARPLRTTADDQPRQDYVILPDRSRLPIARWEFDAERWTVHLNHAGLKVASVHELGDHQFGPWPTTLLITARRD